MLSSQRKRIIDFRDQRDWKQFHDPKNLAEAIIIEAGELLENFLWKTTEESRNLPSDTVTAIGEEIADIAIFVAMIAHEMDLDLEAIIDRKLDINEKKYPVETSKGSAAKYTDIP